jgi:hypothetical protein
MRTVIVLCLIAAAATICDAQWTHIGLAGRRIADIAAGNDILIVATGDSDLLRSTDGGNSWLSVVPMGMRSFRAVVAVSRLSGSMFVHGCSYPWMRTDTLYRSTDNGASWTATLSRDFGESTIAVDPNGIIFAGYSYGYSRGHTESAVRSLDDGMSWTNVGPPGSGDSYAFRGGSIITAGWLWGEGWNVNVSSDSGSTWEFICGAPGHKISVGPDGTIVCVGWSYGGSFVGLCRSTDQGTTWTQIGHIDAKDILSLPSGGTLAATNGGGLFLFSADGDSLGTRNEGLTNLNAHALEMDAIGYVYAGTDSGVFRIPVSRLTDVKDRSDEVPAAYVLCQNYPNPFNPSTTIRYALPQTSFVTLTVYNTLGQQVAELVNEQQQAGYHDVVFRGDGLASGVYFYRIQAGDFVDVKKLILLR